jgi:hypothetical protein
VLSTPLRDGSISIVDSDTSYADSLATTGSVLGNDPRLNSAYHVMARIQSPPVLSQIRVARSYAEQAAALRALKDEIIGHVQRKEWWVQNGILESLVKILQNNARPPPRSNGKDRSQIEQPGTLAEDDTVRLLSLQLLASFTYGECAAVPNLADIRGI